MGVLGMGALIFAPLGLFFQSFALHVPSFDVQLLNLIGGMAYLFGSAAFYFAVRVGQASRIAPVVFSLIPIVTYAISAATGREALTPAKTGGIALLILGGMVISLHFPLQKKKRLFSGFPLALLAGLLLGVSYVLFKEAYVKQSFYSGFVWTRSGLLVGALTLLLVPSWRKSIWLSFHSARHAPREHYATGKLFVFNKILGGTSSILLNKAIQLGSVTAVNAMISVQYVFVLLIAVMASRKNGEIFEELHGPREWVQKISAIAIIALGMYCIS